MDPSTNTPTTTTANTSSSIGAVSIRPATAAGINAASCTSPTATAAAFRLASACDAPAAKKDTSSIPVRQLTVTTVSSASSSAAAAAGAGGVLAASSPLLPGRPRFLAAHASASRSAHVQQPSSPRDEEPPPSPTSSAFAIRGQRGGRLRKAQTPEPRIRPALKKRTQSVEIGGGVGAAGIGGRSQKPPSDSSLVDLSPVADDSSCGGGGGGVPAKWPTRPSAVRHRDRLDGGKVCFSPRIEWLEPRDEPAESTTTTIATTTTPIAVASSSAAIAGGTSAASTATAVAGASSQQSVAQDTAQQAESMRKLEAENESLRRAIENYRERERMRSPRATPVDVTPPAVTVAAAAAAAAPSVAASSSTAADGSSQEDAEEDEVEKAVEASPDGTFLKLDVEIGRGSFKTVYKGLDTTTGVFVAWCELQLSGNRLSKKERDRFREEADLMKGLTHPNIVRFFDYWEVERPKRRCIVLVTELMTSGTLRTYLKNFGQKKVSLKIIKSWCRQILRGLQFLHSRSPPVIHRDLKCDNIFISGTTGQVKVGDLGLATLKNRSFAKSVIGTPEFMAPEVYEEHYDEAVDVYAFGMCMLEMLTSEYPYSECTGPAQIYKKVVTGVKPFSLEKVDDLELRQLIEWLICPNRQDRPTVKELLMREFFAEDCGMRVDVAHREETMCSDGSTVELRLRVLDAKKRRDKHKENEAIQFNYLLGKDNPDEIAKQMMIGGLLSEEDVRPVAKMITSQIQSLLRSREEKRRESSSVSVPASVVASQPSQQQQQQQQQQTTPATTTTTITASSSTAPVSSGVISSSTTVPSSSATSLSQTSPAVASAASATGSITTSQPTVSVLSSLPDSVAGESTAPVSGGVCVTIATSSVVASASPALTSVASNITVGGNVDESSSCVASGTAAAVFSAPGSAPGVATAGAATSSTSESVAVSSASSATVSSTLIATSGEITPIARVSTATAPATTHSLTSSSTETVCTPTSAPPTAPNTTPSALVTAEDTVGDVSVAGGGSVGVGLASTTSSQSQTGAPLMAATTASAVPAVVSEASNEGLTSESELGLSSDKKERKKQTKRRRTIEPLPRLSVLEVKDGSNGPVVSCLLETNQSQAITFKFDLREADVSAISHKMMEAHLLPRDDAQFFRNLLHRVIDQQLGNHPADANAAEWTYNGHCDLAVASDQLKDGLVPVNTSHHDADLTQLIDTRRPRPDPADVTSVILQQQREHHLTSGEVMTSCQPITLDCCNTPSANAPKVLTSSQFFVSSITHTRTPADSAASSPLNSDETNVPRLAGVATFTDTVSCDSGDPSPCSTVTASAEPAPPSLPIPTDDTSHKTPASLSQTTTATVTTTSTLASVSCADVSLANGTEAHLTSTTVTTSCCSLDVTQSTSVDCLTNNHNSSETNVGISSAPMASRSESPQAPVAGAVRLATETLTVTAVHGPISHVGELATSSERTSNNTATATAPPAALVSDDTAELIAASPDPNVSPQSTEHGVSKLEDLRKQLNRLTCVSEAAGVSCGVGGSGPGSLSPPVVVSGSTASPDVHELQRRLATIGSGQDSLQSSNTDAQTAAETSDNFVASTTASSVLVPSDVTAVELVTSSFSSPSTATAAVISSAESSADGVLVVTCEVSSHSSISASVAVSGVTTTQQLGVEASSRSASSNESVGAGGVVGSAAERRKPPPILLADLEKELIKLHRNSMPVSGGGVVVNSAGRDEVYDEMSTSSAMGTAATSAIMSPVSVPGGEPTAVSGSGAFLLASSCTPLLTAESVDKIQVDVTSEQRSHNEHSTISLAEANEPTSICSAPTTGSSAGSTPAVTVSAIEAIGDSANTTAIPPSPPSSSTVTTAIRLGRFFVSAARSPLPCLSAGPPESSPDASQCVEFVDGHPMFVDLLARQRSQTLQLMSQHEQERIRLRQTLTQLWTVQNHSKPQEDSGS